MRRRSQEIAAGTRPSRQQSRRARQRYVGRRNPRRRRSQPHGFAQGARRLSGADVRRAPAQNHVAPENRRTPRRSRRARRVHSEKHRAFRRRNRNKRRLGKGPAKLHPSRAPQFTRCGGFTSEGGGAAQNRGPAFLVDRAPAEHRRFGEPPPPTLLFAPPKNLFSP